MNNQIGTESSLQSQTAGHYDDRPFDFMTPEDELKIEELQPRPFKKFVTTCMNSGDQVAEIGCGPGRATLYLERKGYEVMAIDLSKESLQLARKRAFRMHFAQATNLSLPFADKFFDVVISDGVIHHTPDAKRAFEENSRILKNGGYLYRCL